MGKFSTMSISILIPTYNYDCTKLVKDVQMQAESRGLDYEIIIGDDGSTDGNIVSKLVELCSHSRCKLHRVKRNVGRASIRNMIGHEATYDNLLFMDSDAELVASNFLDSYLKAIQSHDLVSGIISHSATPPSSDKMLRYEYEKSCEKHFTAHNLNKMPYAPFSTFCFMIRKELFSQFNFDESFIGYGYEDVMYGKLLREHGHKVYYIDTPLQHNGMEPNVKFIEKTETALKTLKIHSEELKDEVKLLRFVNKLNKFCVSGLVRILLKPFLNSMRENLCSDEANLQWLNLYKLGYYLNEKIIR